VENRYNMFREILGIKEEPVVYYGAADGGFTTTSPSAQSDAREGRPGNGFHHAANTNGDTPSASGVMPSLFSILEPMNREELPSSLAYSLATNKRLREQILHHAPQGSEPLWLIPYIEKQMELVQESLQKDEGQSIFNVGLRKIFNKDFISKVLEAYIFEIMTSSPKEVIDDTLGMFAPALLRGMEDQETLAEFRRIWSQITGKEDVCSVVEGYAPVTSSISNLLDKLRVSLSSLQIEESYQVKYPKMSAVLEDVKSALSEVLSFASLQAKDWGGVEQQDWNQEAITEKIQKDFEQLKKVHRETLLSHPDCYGLLLKDLEVHASLAGMVEENS
jgi:hypothetical protein